MIRKILVLIKWCIWAFCVFFFCVTINFRSAQTRIDLDLDVCIPPCLCNDLFAFSF